MSKSKKKTGTTQVVAGVDLGGTQVRVALAQRDGKIVKSLRARTTSLGGPQGFVDWVGRELDEALDGKKAASVGIGAPGPCAPDEGLLVNPPNLPGGWQHNLPLGPMLAK